MTDMKTASASKVSIEPADERTKTSALCGMLRLNGREQRWIEEEEAEKRNQITQLQKWKIHFILDFATVITKRLNKYASFWHIDVWLILVDWLIFSVCWFHARNFPFENSLVIIGSVNFVGLLHFETQAISFGILTVIDPNSLVMLAN